MEKTYKLFLIGVATGCVITVICAVSNQMRRTKASVRVFEASSLVILDGGPVPMLFLGRVMDSKLRPMEVIVRLTTPSGTLASATKNGEFVSDLSESSISRLEIIYDQRVIVDEKISFKFRNNTGAKMIVVIDERNLGSLARDVSNPRFLN